MDKTTVMNLTWTPKEKTYVPAPSIQVSVEKENWKMNIILKKIDI